MSNTYKFCSCKACRSGRHRSFGSCIIKRLSRKYRHSVKLALKQDKECPRTISIPYTD